MNEQINKLIPKAIEGIGKFLVKEDNSLLVAKEYKGYISSLGASISQAGLLATISFYTDNSKTREDTDRNNVLKLIHFLLVENTHNEKLLDYLIVNSLKGTPEEKKNKIDNANSSITISNLNFDLLYALEDKIIECTTAIKLALRTFDIKKLD